MPQYRDGTVDVVNGSPNVAGNGTEFAEYISAGDLFTIADSGVTYIVSSVTDDTNLVLTANYGETTANGVDYRITIDFTTDFDIPLIHGGDFDWTIIFREAMTKIDELLLKASFVFKVSIVAGADAFIFNAAAPFKFRVIDAWSNNTSADGGTWKVTNGTNDISDVVTVAASDEDLDRISEIDDAYYEIDKNGTLKIVATGSLDCEIYIKAIKIS